MPDPRSQSRSPSALLGPILVLGVAAPAWAHDAGSSVAGIGGLVSGFVHPLLGFDHMIAMIAVGLWAALLGGAALWRLPLAFLLLMAAGGALGMAGIPLPAVESGIAVSAIVLGAVVAAALAPAPAIAAVTVGCFAILHGNAHGTEWPAEAGALGYAVGFILATAMLHLAGIGIGRLVHRPFGRIAVRVSGGAVALAGTALLFGLA